jgi:histidine ammonia-lyase
MIKVGGSVLSSEDFSDIIFRDKRVSLDSEALKKVETNYQFLRNFSSNTS